MVFFTFSYHIFITSYYLEILKNPSRSHLCNFLRFWHFCASRQLSLTSQFSPGFCMVQASLFIFSTNHADSFLKPDFTSSIVPRNISAICQKFCTFFPLYYLFFRIFLSEYCSSYYQSFLCPVFLEVLCWF